MTSGYISTFSFATTYYNISNYERNLYLTKHAITFDQKEIERKKRYLVGMKFCCASHAAIKNVKIAIVNKKYRFLENISYIFRFCRFFPSF